MKADIRAYIGYTLTNHTPDWCKYITPYFLMQRILTEN